MGHGHAHGGACSHGHGHGHGHGSHHHGPTTSARLALSSAIFGLNFLVQGLGGLWTGSLGLASDSLENLNDAAVNLLGLGSISVANRREPTDRYTYGWHRLEILHTLFGATLLLGLAVVVVREAWHRLQDPQPIKLGWAIAFSALGLALNLAATVVLVPPRGSRQERDLNLRSAYLHALGDSLANLGVMASMVVIRFTGWRWVDPAVALAITVLILRGAFSLFRDAVDILMHRAPFDLDRAKAAVLALPGIRAVEDLRAWRMCSHLTIATAHVVVDAARLEETEHYLEDIEHVLSRDFGVRHLTLHFETADMAARHHHRFIHQHEAAGVEDPVHHGEHRHEHDHDHD